MRKFLLVLILLFSGPVLAAQDSELAVFRKTAYLYWQRASVCWPKPGKPYLSQNENRRVIDSCIRWASHYWPKYENRYRGVQYRLHRSEGENPNDPSYGPWGSTIGTARFVEREYPIAEFPFPQSDDALRERLSTNIEFAGYVAASILFNCTKAYPSPRWELRSIMRYKMGPRGKWLSKRAGIRKRHYGKIKKAWMCVEHRVRNDMKRLCDCMIPGAS